MKQAILSACVLAASHNILVASQDVETTDGYTISDNTYSLLLKANQDSNNTSGYILSSNTRTWKYDQDEDQMYLGVHLELKTPMRQEGQVTAVYSRFQDPDSNEWESYSSSVIFTTKEDFDKTEWDTYNYLGNQDFYTASGSYNDYNTYGTAYFIDAQTWVVQQQFSKNELDGSDELLFNNYATRKFDAADSTWTLKVGDKIKWRAGYRVFPSISSKTPIAKGESDVQELTVLEVASATSLAISATAAFGLISTLFN